MKEKLKETHKHIETLLFGNNKININEISMIFNKARAHILDNLAYINIYICPMFLYIALNMIYICVCAIFVDIIKCVS